MAWRVAIDARIPRARGSRSSSGAVFGRDSVADLQTSFGRRYRDLIANKFVSVWVERLEIDPPTAVPWQFRGPAWVRSMFLDAGHRASREDYPAAAFT